MIKKMLFICFTWIVGVSNAQITTTLQVPPSGVLMKNQLWNIMLVSGSDNAGSISLSLLDAQTNQVVMTAVTRRIDIKKGATQVKADLLAPIQYEYYSSIFNNDRDPNGMLPAGSYIACYTISGGHSATMSENCINVNVEPLSPPLLNSPANESVLQTPYPQFTWLPPTPVNIFGDLNYDFSVVEVLPGQSSIEAIQNNIPVINAGRLRDIFLNYPASYKQLDTGRLYAWHVTARNNGQAVGQSETWTFKVQPPVQIPIKDSSNYILLQKGELLSGNYVFDNPLIKIKYYSTEKDRNAEVKISSIDGQVVKSLFPKITYGDNFLTLSLGSEIKKETVYRIEIIDLTGNKYSAFFTIKQ